MDCLICQLAAEDVTYHRFDGATVRCPQCGVYDVSGRAISVLPQMEPAARIAALTDAQNKAVSGRKPIVVLMWD